MKLVSIIMGTFNSEDRIENTVKSIQEQAYSNWELLIVNDCSTDNTENVLKYFQNNDQRIMYWNNDENKGLAYSLNKGLAKSKGQYIMRIDDDDICLPGRIEKQVNFMEKNPQFAILGGNALLVEKNKVWGERRTVENPNKFDIFMGQSFIHPTVMMNKDLLLSIGGYSDSKKYDRCEDYELWCKFYKNGYKGHNLQDNLILYSEGKNDYKKRKKRYRIIFVKAMIEQKSKLEIGLEGVKIIVLNISKIFIPNKFIYLIKKHKKE
ncbi:MAG: glycosyltransferase family 2 protein [Vagococcus fluvialis]